MAVQRGIGPRGRGLAAIRRQRAPAWTDEFHDRALELTSFVAPSRGLGAERAARLLILG